MELASFGLSLPDPDQQRDTSFSFTGLISFGLFYSKVILAQIGETDKADAGAADDDDTMA